MDGVWPVLWTGEEKLVRFSTIFTYLQTDEYGTWSGAYDWYPCSHARFLQLEDDSWINNTTYCPGSGSECGEVLVTAPVVYWSSPGVLRHDYPQSEAPIVPQIEDWKWMWVSEDNMWAVVIWCGSNPMLEYNGAFVLHRERTDGTIPEELKPVIRLIFFLNWKSSFHFAGNNWRSMA